MSDALWSAFMKTGDPFCYLMEKVLKSGSEEHMAQNSEGGKPPD